MKAQYTPGPWTTEKRLTTEISIRASERTIIAGARCDSYLPGYESDANARLISAAPELLAACQAVLTRQDWPVGTCKIKTQVQSAIAKALGQ